MDKVVLPVALLSFFGLVPTVPLVILGFFLHRVRILKQDWRPLLAKGVAAVAVWGVLSFLMFNVEFAYVFAGAHTPPERRGELGPNLGMLAFVIGYGLAAWGLCYWAKDHRPSSRVPPSIR